MSNQYLLHHFFSNRDTGRVCEVTSLSGDQTVVTVRYNDGEVDEMSLRRFNRRFKLVSL